MALESCLSILINQSSWVRWDATTHYHKLGGVNRQCFFLTVLEVGKSKTRRPTDSVYGGSLSGLQLTDKLLLNPCMEKGKRLSVSCLFSQNRIPLFFLGAVINITTKGKLGRKEVFFFFLFTSSHG